MNFQPPDPDDFGHCLMCHRGIEKSEQSGGVCFECQITNSGNEPAFPVGANEYGGHGTVFGVTVRDYFAAKALQSTIIAWEGRDLQALVREHQMEIAEIFACEAYEIADAMLAARSK